MGTLSNALIADIAFIIGSFYTHSEIDKEGVLDEGLQFIQKPFTPETLAERVRAVLST